MLTLQKILDLAHKNGTITTNDFIEQFGVSKPYILRLISKLLREAKLIKIGSTRSAFYTTEGYLQKHPELVPASYSKSFVNKRLEEHRVYSDILDRFTPLSQLSENVKSIFEYAFSEMMNNAIEHSRSKKVKVTVSLEKNTLTFVVDDFGIGVFRNVMKKRKLKSELEAIQDILKGKTTTLPKLHSGEGIFFTSKVGDEFTLDSYGYQLLVDNKIHDVFVSPTRGKKQGTRVTFRINVNAKHHLNDIFKEYANIHKDSDYGFDKTKIRVKLFTIGGVHISRSQARRVLSGLEKFRVIEMDYDHVPIIGQAFADEIYRVFQNKKPGIRIVDVNTNESVKFMINRAKNERKAT